MNPTTASTPPWRSSNRHAQHPPSPLNPATNLCTVSPTRRLSGASFPYPRKSSVTNSPTHYLPRSPLSSNCSTLSSYSSSSSSSGWQLRTPPFSTTSLSDLPSPSPTAPSPIQPTLVPKCKPNWSKHPSRIQIPAVNPMSSGFKPFSPSMSDKRHTPSPLDILDHLHSIPPSPPVVYPALLLGHPLNITADSHSPFAFGLSSVDADLSSTSMLDLQTNRHLHGQSDTHRDSSFDNKMQRLVINCDDNVHDADDHRDDASSRVPAPTTSQRSI